MNEEEYADSAEANQSEILCCRLSGCKSCIVSLTQELRLPQSPLFRMELASAENDNRLLHPSSEASSSLTLRGLEELSNEKKYSSRRRRISSFLTPALALSLLLTLLGGIPLAGAQSLLPSTTPPVSAPPTRMPTTPPPTNLSTMGPAATNPPTANPTFTSSPTAAPTRSPMPSVAPTRSPMPTPVPTLQPTVTHSPSYSPSGIPSGRPSGVPSEQPTVEPTFGMTIVATAKFRQQFTIGNGRIFTMEETALLQDLYQSYTNIFGPHMTDGSRIDSSCQVDIQVGLNRRRLGGRANQEGRQLQTFEFNAVDYTMTYTSKHSNVSTYPLLFQNYVNSNLDKVTLDIQTLGLNVTEAASANRIFVIPDPTPAPTSTPQPTPAPSLRPTASTFPSLLPSYSPSLTPSEKSEMPSASSPLPTIYIDGTPQTTESPSDPPTPPPTEDQNDTGVTDNTVIVVSIVVAGSVVLMGLFFYYRRRKFLQEQEFQTNAASGMNNNSRKAEHAGGGDLPDDGSWNAAVRKTPGFEGPASAAAGTPFDKGGGYTSKVPVPAGPGGMVSPSESLVSNQSLLSAGNSMAGDSGDEADATQNLADEFDQYKDQNLEKMRADVEGNLTGFDGMMSQALTKALIDDDDLQVDPTELLWGGSGKRTGPEIEASALGEVTDWLKRKENVSVEEK